MKRFALGALRALGVLVGLYLVARAVAEPFVIDVTDPASYRGDWGGPALAGVLAVHMGPGILAGLALFGAARRRLIARRERAATGGAPLTAGRTGSGPGPRSRPAS